MKVEISVSEIVEVFKEIQEQPGKILEMVRADMPKVVGEYLSEIMQVELTRFLGRKPYERMEELANHRNGSYPRNFALKGIGEVAVKVPRDRNGEYRTQVIPKSKQYEDELMVGVNYFCRLTTIIFAGSPLSFFGRSCCRDCVAGLLRCGSWAH